MLVCVSVCVCVRVCARRKEEKEGAGYTVAALAADFDNYPVSPVQILASV